MQRYGFSISGAEQTIEVLTDNETTPCETISMLRSIIRSIEADSCQCEVCENPICEP
jgi:hypothetical protein